MRSSQTWQRVVWLFLCTSTIFIAIFLSYPTQPTAAQTEPESRTPINTVPTINASLASGPPEEAVTLSGMGVISQTTLRLHWRYNNKSTPIAVVNIPQGPDSDYAYSFSTRIPADATPGQSVQACATLPTADSSLYCTPISVTEIEPATISGVISTTYFSPSELPSIIIFDPGERSIKYSTQINPDGSFNFPSVRPGAYQAEMVGVISQTLGWDRFTVFSGDVVTDLLSIARTTVPEGETPDDFAPACTYGRVTNLRGGYLNLTKQKLHDYIEGVPLDIFMEADVQAADIAHVEFIVTNDAGYSEVTTDSSAPYETSFNIAPLTIDNDLNPFLDQRYYVRAVIVSTNGDREEVCGSNARFRLFKSPISPDSIRNGEISFVDNRYEFSGILDSDKLPADYAWDISYFGFLANEIDIELPFEGTYFVDSGLMRLEVTADSRGTLMGFDLWDGTRNVPITYMEGRQYSPQYIEFPLGPNGETQVTEIANFADAMSLYEGTVWSGWGIVDVNVALDLGIEGTVELAGDVRPFAGEADITMNPVATPSADMSVYVDILLGVAKAGANVVTTIDLGLPLKADIRPSTAEEPETVAFGDHCLAVAMDLYAWARVNLWFWKSKWRTGPYNLLEYPDSNGCRLSGRAMQTLDPELDLSASPFVATSPDGRHLQVQVINQAGADGFIPIVVARWADPNTGDFGNIELVSTPGESVLDPVAAVFGNTGHAIVIWTQNSLSETDPEPSDIYGILNYQDLMYSYYDGTSWSTPAALKVDTTTPYADGSVDLSADSSGVTAVWVRDTDGDASTNDDKRIMAIHGIENSGSFSWDTGSETELGGYLNATSPDAALNSSIMADSPRSFQVNSTADLADMALGDGICMASNGHCTLRAAIQESNASADMETIYLPSGTITMTLNGRDEDLAATGDFDIRNPVTIIGAGRDATKIEGNFVDRIFEQSDSTADLDLQHLTLTGGDVFGNGGGILSRADLSLYEVTILSNFADNGGGIYSERGRVEISNTTIDSNVANFDGGAGLYISNTLSTLARNIYIQQSAIVRNNSLGNGSGLYQDGRNTFVVITSTTFSQNGMAFEGGAIYHTDGQITLNNVTIADNQTNGGSAIVNLNNGTTFQIENSIIGFNLNAGSNCSGVLLDSQGSNINYDNSCFSDPLDQLTTDPMLGTLDYHDGTTLNYDLQAGSPAIDMGNVFTCEYHDQRGVRMLIDGTIDGTNRCDIGAHEAFSANALNTQPSVDRRGGKIVLAWTVDADSNVGTSVDRRLMVAEWNDLTDIWDVDMPLALPNHVDSADIAYNSHANSTQLVFLYHNLLPDGETRAGVFTDQAEVWTAEKPDNGSWQQGSPMQSENYGELVRGEAPRIDTVEATGESVILFRRFGDPSTRAGLGQMAMATRQMHQTDFRPATITDIAGEVAAVSLAIDPRDGGALMASEQRFFEGFNRATSDQRAPSTTSWPTYSSDTLLVSLAETADPALEADIILSQEYVPVGDTVTLTTTLINLGRGTASDMTVSLYRDQIDGANLVTSQLINGPFALSDSQQLSFTVTTLTPEETLYLQVTSPVTDTTDSNNTISTTLRPLSPPTVVTAIASDFSDTQIQLSWEAPQTGTADTYRVLRSTTSGTNYQLVGETGNTSFTDDLSVEPNVRAALADTYYYAIQAVDAAGSTSAYSDEAIFTATDDVQLALTAPTSTVYLTDTMQITIDVQSDAVEVDQISAQLQFDPTIFQVSQIEAGTMWATVISQTVDNTAGTLNFVATATAPYPSGTFSAAIVTLTPLTTTTSSDISFTFATGSASDILFDNDSLLSGHTDLTLSVAEWVNTEPTDPTDPTDPTEPTVRLYLPFITR